MNKDNSLTNTDTQCVSVETGSQPISSSDPIYTREFILKYRCEGSVEFLNNPKVSVRKPRQQHNRRSKPKLIISENAWSENRKSDDRYEEIKKKTLGLLNKLTLEKYDKISEKFMDIIKDYTFTEEQLEEFIPVIYEIILKQLLYKGVYTRLFKRLNNPEFNKILVNHSKKEFLVSIGEIEDTRKITSLLEDENDIKKRYSLNNISFIIDLYGIRLIGKDEITNCIEKIIETNNVDLLCYFSKNYFKNHKHDMYEKTIQYLEQVSKDKSNPAKLRFMCMDVLDIIR